MGPAHVSARQGIRPDRTAGWLAQTSQTNEALYAQTDLALARYLALPVDEREEFRTALRDLTRLYAFLAHVVPVGSPDMERIYLYGRVLLPRLPSDDDEGIVDLSGAAILTHQLIEKSAFTDASLTTVSDQESEQKGHTGAGQGRQYDDPSERLSSIIGTLNDRFGLNLTEADQLFFEQVEVEVAKNPRAQLVARNNDIDQFMTVFDGLLAAFLDKPDFRDTLTQMIGREFYKTIRASGKSA